MSIYKLLKGIVVFDLFNSKKTYLTVPKLIEFVRFDNFKYQNTMPKKKVKRIIAINATKLWKLIIRYISGISGLFRSMYYFGTSDCYALKFQNNMFGKS